MTGLSPNTSVCTVSLRQSSSLSTSRTAVCHHQLFAVRQLNTTVCHNTNVCFYSSAFSELEGPQQAKAVQNTIRRCWASVLK